MSFRTKLLMTALTCASLLVASPVSAKQPVLGSDIIGTILEVEGSASINNGKSVQKAFVNTPVHTGDVLSTGPGARVYVLLIDNTELTLSENGQMEINDYVFNPKDSRDNTATYSFMKGAFLYVSGLVAKKKDPDVNIKIPSGSIGIRGTRFWAGEVKGDYGVVVGDGEVEVKTKRGNVRLKRGQGTSIKKTIAGPTPTPVKEWEQDKIQAAVQTVTFAAPEAIGERIQVEREARQPNLVAQHVEVQQEVLAEIKEAVEAVNPDLAENLTREDLKELRRDVALAPDVPFREIVETNLDEIKERHKDRLETDETGDPVTASPTSNTLPATTQTQESTRATQDLSPTAVPAASLPAASAATTLDGTDQSREKDLKKEEWFEDRQSEDSRSKSRDDKIDVIRAETIDRRDGERRNDSEPLNTQTGTDNQPERHDTSEDRGKNRSESSDDRSGNGNRDRDDNNSRRDDSGKKNDDLKDNSRKDDDRKDNGDRKKRDDDNKKDDNKKDDRGNNSGKNDSDRRDDGGKKDDDRKDDSRKDGARKDDDRKDNDGKKSDGGSSKKDGNESRSNSGQNNKKNDDDDSRKQLEKRLKKQGLM